MPETKTKIRVCNAGSSSLKFSLFDAEDEVLVADGGIDWLRKPAQLVLRGPNQPEIREDATEQSPNMRRTSGMRRCV
jgi:acetate kinase